MLVCSPQISELKDSLTEKDAYYHKEMENMRTNADRDVWELRRKLQRLDEKNWAQQELLQEKHQEELGESLLKTGRQTDRRMKKDR